MEKINRQTVNGDNITGDSRLAQPVMRRKGQKTTSLLPLRAFGLICVQIVYTTGSAQAAASDIHRPMPTYMAVIG